jgi:hypothetical protein
LSLGCLIVSGLKKNSIKGDLDPKLQLYRTYKFLSKKFKKFRIQIQAITSYTTVYKNYIN